MRDWRDFQPTVPVQLEDDRSVHDGEAQQADPAQEDAAKHAGVEVHDHDLRNGTTSVSAGNESGKTERCGAPDASTTLLSHVSCWDTS